MAAALAVLTVPLATTSVGAAPISAEGTTAARLGSSWLSQRLEVAVPLQVFGSPSWGATLEAATALAAIDSADPLIGDIWKAAVADREEAVSDGVNDLPGRLAQMILLAHTTGQDPRSVGPAPGQDLVARLEATLTPSGIYGVQTPTYDGVYRQGQSIAALAAAGATPDATAVQWILDQQCQGAFQGAWMGYRSDTDVACVSDPANWVGPDSNAAALAITALHEAVPDNPVAAAAIADGLDWLDQTQNDDGGWAINPWGATDPNSTAVVIQTLVATSTLRDGRFGDKAATPLEALLSFQLGADSPESDRGAFTYPQTDNSPSEMATVQAVVAAAGWPLVFVAVAGSGDGPTSTTSTTVATPRVVSTTTVIPSGTARVGAAVLGVSDTRGISFAG